MDRQLMEVQDQIASVLRGLESYHRYGSVAELEAAINYLAHKAGVETFGRLGEVVEYKPLEQYLVDPSELAIEHVSIVSLGVRAKREDGSYRLLSRAMVKNGGMP